MLLQPNKQRLRTTNLNLAWNLMELSGDEGKFPHWIEWNKNSKVVQKRHQSSKHFLCSLNSLDAYSDGCQTSTIVSSTTLLSLVKETGDRGPLMRLRSAGKVIWFLQPPTYKLAWSTFWHYYWWVPPLPPYTYQPVPNHLWSMKAQNSSLLLKQCSAMSLRYASDVIVYHCAS